MNFRSVDSFYQLSSLLKSHHPWLSVPPLPLRPSFWISSVRQVFLVELKMLTIHFHDASMVGYDIMVLMRPVRSDIPFLYMEHHQWGEFLFLG